MIKILNENRKRQLKLLYQMQDREWHKINQAKKELAKINMRIQRVESGKSAIPQKELRPGFYPANS